VDRPEIDRAPRDITTIMSREVGAIAITGERETEVARVRAEIRFIRVTEVESGAVYIVAIKVNWEGG
jgi:hypothetical protein